MNSEAVWKKRLEERMKVDPILRELYPKLPPLRPKPKTAVVTELEGKIAEVARANPGSVSVRVTAKTEENVVVADRPRRGNVVDVIEVENGKPKLVRTYDAEAGGHGVAEFKDGYGPSYHPKGGGAVHQYNPLDALEKD
jgi:hypothetical protein